MTNETKEAMSKSIPWILVAALALILYVRYIVGDDVRIMDLTNERNAIQLQADSLRTMNAQLLDSVEVHKLNASKATAIADSLMKTDPQVIVDERVKLNRYATAEKVGEGLVKQLP